MRRSIKQLAANHLSLPHHRDNPNRPPSRWRSNDLDPVPKADKKWEWYHVGGFWIAEGFSAAQVQTSSAAVAIGLNPGLALAAYAIGNIQSYLGGLSIQVMIQSLFPSFTHWRPSALPPSADITASALLGFAIFWLLSLPFLYIRPPQLRWLFIAKIATMPFLWTALFAWALTAAGGFGPLMGMETRAVEEGMGTGYLFCYAVTASISGVNNVAGNSIAFGNDLMTLFPRFINIRRGQFICAILGFAICPWKIQKGAPRFLAFLNGYSIFLGPIAGGRSSISSILSLFFFFPNQPTNGGFESKTSTTNAQTAAVMLTDYYILRRHAGLNIHQLYTPGGLYWYRGGVNWRAVVSFFVGLVPLLPSLVHGIDPQGVGAGVARGYIEFSSLSWLECIVFASLSYYTLAKISPFAIKTEAEDEMAWAICGSGRRGGMDSEGGSSAEEGGKEGS
ncbi:MAG: hypothetical protein Q9208_005335 [Pyrenodesmia sp. 3 TL-2023]